MPQQLKLEVESGPLKGQTVIVQDHRTVVVGRLPECGLSFPQDLTVSRQHCRLEFDSPSCRLIHLSQTGETLVNGNSVTGIELRSGDEIEFGAGNRIRVTIEDAATSSTFQTVMIDQVGYHRTNESDSYTRASVSCDWILYQSVSEQLDYKTLLKILIKAGNASAVIDFRRCGLSTPPELTNPEYLFSWLQPPNRDQFSPVVVSFTENDQVKDVIIDGWGKDGIVCFGCKLKGPSLATYWQKAIGCPDGQPGTAMTAYFWPSIVNSVLTCQSAEQVDGLLRELDWIFVESAKSPGKWNLFTKSDFASVLSKSGLVELAESPTKKS